MQQLDFSIPRTNRDCHASRWAQNRSAHASHTQHNAESKPRVICKLDLEKAYDCVENFLIYEKDGLWGKMETLDQGMCFFINVLNVD